MPLPVQLSISLPEPLPDDLNARLCLLGIRRLGAHGLADAGAAHHFIQAFGGGFRRPLVALRIMMAEISVASSTPMIVAPCCCPRVTGAEFALLKVIGDACTDPGRARLLLADLLGNRQVDGVLSSITLVASAFADAGRPIR